MKKKILLIGAGGHARSCIDVIEKEKKYNIYGLIGLKKEVGKKINGYEVLATENDIQKYIKRGIKYALITLGGFRNAKSRFKLFNDLKKKKFIFPSIISPMAHISNSSRILEGTIVMHGAIVNSNSIIGSNCIINSKSLVEHDCILEDNVHISTGAIINGSVKIGSNSFIGSGSIIRNNLTLKRNSFVKMGSVIKK